MTWRVVVSGNSGDGFHYRLADLVADHFDDGLIEVIHNGEGSVEQLKGRVRAQEEAFRLPEVAFVPAHFEQRKAQ